MKSLAKGTSSDAIFKLLKVTINTQQQIFAEANEFTEGIDDIADKLVSNKQLFEENNGVDLQNREEEEEVKKSYVGEQIDEGVKNAPTWMPGQKTGRRSEAFDFLLNQENEMPQSKYSKKRDNYEQYINDLCGGDIEMEQERVKTEKAKKEAKKQEKETKKQQSNKDYSQQDRETGATSDI